MNCEYQKHFVFVIANYPINKISIFRTFWIDQSATNLFTFITQLNVNYIMYQNKKSLSSSSRRQIRFKKLNHLCLPEKVHRSVQSKDPGQASG